MPPLPQATVESAPSPRRLRPGGSASGRPSILAIAILATAFSALAVVVAGNVAWVVDADAAVSRGFSATHTGALNRAMFAITLLGDRWVIGAFLALIAAWVLRTGRCRTPLGVMIIAFALNPALEAALKGLVGRQRPELAQLVAGTGPAFPSGHVLATAGFYGVLAVVAWRSTTRRSLAVGSLVSAALVVTLVGLSRIYLGVHWMTDVVGGIVVGSAFVIAAAWFLGGHHLGTAGISRCGCLRAGPGRRRSPGRPDATATRSFRRPGR